MKTEVLRESRKQAVMGGLAWPRPADCRANRASGNLGSQSAEGQLKEVLIQNRANKGMKSCLLQQHDRTQMALC